MTRLWIAGILAFYLWAIPGRAAGSKKNISPKAEPAADENITHYPKNEKDLQLAKNVHRAVIGSDELSDSARNATIIINNGNVTLHGMAETAGERDLVEAKVRAVPGVKQVVNYIKVKGGD